MVEMALERVSIYNRVVGLRVRCACGAVGPTRERGTQARRASQEQGWSRLYHGSGEDFRCPSCRQAQRSGTLSLPDTPAT